ncbi:MAG: hypothetical protein KAT12_02765 [Gammaproteobacteria bacterium]|nr:hypothetical protein [Gammaproteobacteria bacterium]
MKQQSKTDEEMDSTEEEHIEELILQESIVSAAGLNSEQVLIGIKGDPSLRESAPLRKRYDSKVDSLFDELEPNLEDIMLNRGIYRIFVGFNSGEIRTNSVFDPLRQEIHDAEKIADKNYINRHFPLIKYNDKVALMRELYAALRATEQYQSIPGYWQNILNRRSQHWLPLEPDNITKILTTVRKLRDIEEYYLRNITMCIVQGIVRMQFNCDGTQIIDAHNFKHFLEENI